MTSEPEETSVPYKQETWRTASAHSVWQGVEQIVEAGYKVVEDNISAGADYASKQDAQPNRPQSQSLRELIDQLTYTVSEMGSLTVEIAKALIDNVSGDGHKHQDPAQPYQIPVEVSSHHSVQSMVALNRIPVRNLSVTALNHQSGETRLDQVSLDTGPVLRVEVPPEALSGNYYGLLLEQGVVEPAGTVAIQVT